MTSVNRTLFVVSAPSGAGKHSVIERALEQDAELEFSISATTRPLRDGEVNGKDYFFLDRSEFLRRRDAGAFAEWAEVHGNLYGTLCEELNRHVATGKDVILQIDVQGMRSLKKAGLALVTVFVTPPSLEELERRLKGRATDSLAAREVRLHNARTEMASRFEYDYVVINDRLDDAVADFLAIVRAQRCRSSRHLKE
jgi:guanylate kinase